MSHLTLDAREDIIDGVCSLLCRLGHMTKPTGGRIREEFFLGLANEVSGILTELKALGVDDVEKSKYSAFAHSCRL